MSTDPDGRAERALSAAFANGSRVDLRTGPDDDPRRADWSAARTVRADFINGLLLGHVPVTGAIAGLRLAGARITGRLDLSHATIEHPLDFEGCHFEEPVLLAEARTRSVRLLGCVLGGLEAERSEVRGELQVQGCRLPWLSLYGAHASEVEISGSHIGPAADGMAVRADLLTVDAAFYCHDAEIVGEVRLTNARIDGMVEFDRSSIVNGSSSAVRADNIVVHGGIVGRSLRMRGRLGLLGAQLGGSLNLCGAQIDVPVGERALDVREARIGGSVMVLPDRTDDRPPQIRGRISMRGAEIAGQLRIESVRIEADGDAFSLGRITVGDTVTIDTTSVIGRIDLSAGDIGGFSMGDGCTIKAPGSVAVNLSNAQSHSSVRIAAGTCIQGTVSVGGARIRGVLDMAGVQLADPEGTSVLKASGATIDGDVDVRNLIATGGQLNFWRTTMNGSLDAAGRPSRTRPGRRSGCTRRQCTAPCDWWTASSPTAWSC